jgi:ADP-ribosylglycohydrolase
MADPPLTLQNPPIESRILGCLLGGAVGDALGAPVEFAPLAEIRERFGPAGIREYAPVYGRLGAITDDTQMTLFTAEGLLRAHVRGATRGICHVPSVVQNAYLRWLATQGSRVNAAVAQSEAWLDGWLVREDLGGMRAPGNTCLRALAAVAELGQLPINDSKGCGTVMRIAPVGIVCAPSSAGPWSPFDLGVEVSRLTHGHPTGYLAGGFLALALSHVLDGVPLADAIDLSLARLGDAEEGNEVRAAVEAAVRLARSGEPTPERVESLGGAWVAEEALAVGLYAALTARDFDDGIRLAVNHSGDSDSTGAIAGNLLGALLGVEAIGPHWLAELELRPVIERIAQDLASLRTGRFDVEAQGERYPGW